MKEGYIKLWRKFGETSFFTDSHCVHLAIHFLLECNHEPRRFVFNGEEITLQRGECVTGIYKIQDMTGISTQTIRTSLKTLENVGFLTRKSTNKFSIVSILKYEEYQGGLTSKSTINQQSTNNPLTTNKNDKNEKKGERGANFAPPSLLEVQDYCKEKAPSVNAKKFFFHYKATGWKKAGARIEDWRAAVDAWQNSDFSPAKAPACPASAGSAPAAQYDGQGPEIAYMNAFHEKHTVGCKCAFCGAELQGKLDICRCPAYKAAYDKHRQGWPAQAGVAGKGR